MICKHDRLARSCNECALIDDIAELESAHRMMAARNERLQKENERLRKENAELFHFKQTAEFVLNEETLEIIESEMTRTEDV